MIRTSKRRYAGWSRVFTTLATLAIAFKILVPAGYMVSTAPTNELPFQIVVCTGHGMAVVDPGQALDPSGKDHAPAEKPSHDTPCPFAAHGAAATPPGLAATSLVQFSEYQAIIAPAATNVAPARGLSAPPPPSTGPPSA